MQIQFYHLTSSSFDRAIPPLAQKAREQNYRLHVKLSSKEQQKKLDEWLWSYDQDSFLPHGTANNEHAAQQPILLSTEMENLNQASIMMVTDGSYVDDDTPSLERVLDLFDGNDETTVQAARDRWRRYKDAGFELTYWQQQPNGSWKKAA